MTRVLVTGGSGFIGQQLISALVARGQRVRVLDLRAPTLALPKVQYVEGSVLDPDLVDQSLRDIDQVYHLAGLPGMWMPQKSDFHAVNFGGTKIVVAAARKHGIARFLHCSTESILFRPSPSDGAGGRPAAGGRYAWSLYSIENASRTIRAASGGIWPAGGDWHSDNADWTS